MGNLNLEWDGDSSIILNERICEKHFVELFWEWDKWHTKKTLVKGSPKAACSYPLKKHAENRLSKYRLTKDDVKIIFEKEKKFVHPGTGEWDLLRKTKDFCFYSRL